MKRVPFSIILAAKDYNPDAVNFICQHFEQYVISRCAGTYTDECGRLRTYVDDDLYYEAQHAIFNAIRGFKFQEPPADFTL